MSKIIIETDTIKKAVIYFLAILGLVVIIYFVGINIMNHYSQLQTTVVPAYEPTPLPTPTIVQTPSYPSVLTFTVLSATTSGGRYEVATTDGNTLYFPDFSTWNSMFLHVTYTATIIGEENGAYVVGTVLSPESTQTQSYPSVLTFTLQSKTASTERYEVTTTAGNILYFSDYSIWDSLMPQQTYTTTIIGEENGAYDVGTVNEISSVYSSNVIYPVYYHYNGRYYRYDGHIITPVAPNEVIGRVIEERPHI
jgi:hypothetical protein